jgi:hypothetical protein
MEFSVRVISGFVEQKTNFSSPRILWRGCSDEPAYPRAHGEWIGPFFIAPSVLENRFGLVVWGSVVPVAMGHGFAIHLFWDNDDFEKIEIITKMIAVNV